MHQKYQQFIPRNIASISIFNFVKKELLQNGKIGIW